MARQKRNRRNQLPTRGAAPERDEASARNAALSRDGAFEGFGGILELPPGAVGSGANISLSSNREAVVDGCKGILEFSDTVIRLNTGNMVVRFIGRGLDIRSLTADQAIIAGFIISVDFGS